MKDSFPEVQLFDIPSELYYSEKIDRETLTSAPTGNPYIPALLQAEADFWIAAQQTIRKPKKIIITPSLIRFLEKNHNTNAYEFFEYLVAQGFELYAINPDLSIEKCSAWSLSKKWWSAHKSDGSDVPIDENNIISLCAKQGWSKDELCIVQPKQIEENTRSFSHETKNFLFGSGAIEALLTNPQQQMCIFHLILSRSAKDFFFTLADNPNIRFSRLKILSALWDVDSIEDILKFVEKIPTLEQVEIYFDRDKQYKLLTNIKYKKIWDLLPHTHKADILFNTTKIMQPDEIIHDLRNIVFMKTYTKINKELISGMKALQHLDILSESFSDSNLQGSTLDDLLELIDQLPNLKKISFHFNSCDLQDAQKLQSDNFKKIWDLLDKDTQDTIIAGPKNRRDTHSSSSAIPAIPHSIPKKPLPAKIDKRNANKPSQSSTVTQGDFNTDPNDSPKSLSATQYFTAKQGFAAPFVNQYRLKIRPIMHVTEESYEIRSEPPELISLTEEVTFEDDPYKLIIERDRSENCFHGQYLLQATNQWQALPSLSVNDTMTHAYVEGNDPRIELAYSENENLYYVKNNSGKPLQFHFNVTISPDESTQYWPDGVNETIQMFQKEFTPKALQKEQGKQYTGAELITEIIKQKTGACRHRAAAFKYLMEYTYPQYPVRIIENDVHMFVEININGQWRCCDLGGYPARLNIARLTEPEQPSVAPRKSDLSTKLNPFMRWDPVEHIADNTLQFNQKIISLSEGENVLIDLPSGDIMNYQFSLREYCKKTKRPVYTIHSPKDLMCSANWIERHQHNAGTIQKGPGGPLYDFLQENKDAAPVIIVHWNNFTPEDIAKYNSLIDKERLADGVALPDKTHVIGLYDTHSPTAYQGSDFFSRFSEQHHFPHQASLPQASSLTHTDKHTVPEKHVVIDLYASSQWRSLLLGRWAMCGSELIYREGPLLQALRTGQHVHIQNPPDSEEFNVLMQQLLLEQELIIEREKFNIAPHCQFTTDVGYAWELKNQSLQWDNIQEHIDEALPLNPSFFYRYFSDFEIIQNKIIEKPGWLEQHKGKILYMAATADLSESQWAQLLDEAMKWQVTLTIHPNANLTLPEDMLHPTQSLVDETPALAYGDIVLCDDPHYGAQKIKKDDVNAQIWDCSEFTAPDVLTKIDFDRHHYAENQTFKFTQIKSALLEQLEQGKHIILKGHISAELLDNITPILLGNQKIKGKLTVITSQKERVRLLSYQTMTATLEDKLRLLSSDYSPELIKKINQSECEKLNLLQLKTILQFLEKTPDASFHEAWAGYHAIFREEKPVSLAQPMDLSIEASEQFEEERLEQLNAALKHSPFVFVSGPTGAGKSTFIQSILKERKARYTVYNEITNIEQWAYDQSDTTKILFIDEANIGQHHYSQFEKLFDNPPQILINQKIITLSPFHKIVFAGNPINYGGRHLPSLFDNHGSAITFSSMSDAYLYHKILKPIFDEHRLDEEMQNEILTLFLTTYNKIKALHPDSILMSPRELQMMALLVLSENTPEKKLAKAYEVAQEFSMAVLSTDHQDQFQSWFHQTFLNIPSLNPPTFELELNDFILTPSRHKAYIQMENLLRVRAYQQQSRCAEAQYGGLGGLVFEAEPGVGKSDFVTKMLLKHGFRQANVKSSPPESDENRFYRIPPSLSHKEKEDILHKAFHEGAIVIIDELNSSGMLEKTLNTLLSGRDLEGNRPQTPGFKIIGTENPITYEGRKARSLALKRRLWSGTFPEYPPHELSEILIQKGLSKRRSEHLVQQYFEAKQFAIKHNKIPVPSPRILLTHADFILKEKKQKKAAQSPKLSVQKKLILSTSSRPHNSPTGGAHSPHHRHRP